VYVTDGPPPGRVYVIDAATNTVGPTIPVGSPPGHLAVDPDNALVYLAQFSENQTVDVGHVLVIDPATNIVSDAIPVGLMPTRLAVHPDGSRIYVINALDGTVSVIAQVFAPPPGNLPDLVGKVFGGAAAGGGGWLVIGNHFYKIPPRSPLLVRIARVAAPHLGRPIENRKLGEQLRKTL
jgi:YVTN family beta-propeller protein